MAPHKQQSVSDSDSPDDSDVSVDLSQEGARKRRRMSPVEASDETGPHDSRITSKAAARETTPSISRIKAKEKRPSNDPPSPVRVALREKTNFAALNVDPWLVASLGNMAIKHPTGIQQACIPEIMKGQDCIGGSRTGSGKTVAFAVPMLQQWAKDPSGIFAVVLTPTR